MTQCSKSKCHRHVGIFIMWNVCFWHKLGIIKYDLSCLNDMILIFSLIKLLIIFWAVFMSLVMWFSNTQYKLRYLYTIWSIRVMAGIMNELWKKPSKTLNGTFVKKVLCVVYSYERNLILQFIIHIWAYMAYLWLFATVQYQCPNILYLFGGLVRSNDIPSVSALAFLVCIPSRN